VVIACSAMKWKFVRKSHISEKIVRKLSNSAIAVGDLHHLISAVMIRHHYYTFNSFEYSNPYPLDVQTNGT
jgi:hypothetical protein